MGSFMFFKDQAPSVSVNRWCEKTWVHNEGPRESDAALKRKRAEKSLILDLFNDSFSRKFMRGREERQKKFW